MFHKKYALINITTLFNISFHKFHQFPQFPSISQYFPTFSRYHGFFYPVSAFPHLQGGPYAPTRAIGGSKSTPCLGGRDMGLIFLLRMRFHSLYLHILCTYSQKGSKIDPTCKSAMYRVFLSFQNLDGNIYTWNLYVCVFPEAAHGARMGQPLQLVVAKFTDSDYLKRLERWRARVFVERFWLNGFIEKWWIKYEKLWFNGFDHHK